MLLTVRLGPEEERAVNALRSSSVNVSELVRRALREAAGSGDADPSSLMRQILADVPDAPGRATARPPLDDRRAVQTWLRKKLRRR